MWGTPTFDKEPKVFETDGKHGKTKDKEITRQIDIKGTEDLAVHGLLVHPDTLYTMGMNDLAQFLLDTLHDKDNAADFDAAPC